MSSPDALFDALAALRDADDPLDRRHDPRWRVIDRTLRAMFPEQGPDADEVMQETLLAIGRSVRAMEATSALPAAKWVSTIHRRKKLDGVRARARDPIQRGLDRAREEDGPSAVELLEGDGGGEVDAEALERVLATIEDHVAAHLAETEPSALARHMRRLQARAALRRLVIDEDFHELVAALDADEPLTRDRVYKWVERGRPIVLGALDRWAAVVGAGSTEEQIVEAVREVVGARRVDAGKPRPERRNGGAT